MRCPELTSRQRLQVAYIAGHVQRLGFGNLSHLTLEEKIADLHALSTDPVVLGHHLGDCLANADEIWPGFQACADLLRAAGADEQAAAAKLAWRRWKQQHRASAEGNPIL